MFKELKKQETRKKDIEGDINSIKTGSKSVRTMLKSEKDVGGMQT